MEPRLWSGGCDSGAARGERARVGSEPCAGCDNAPGDAWVHERMGRGPRSHESYAIPRAQGLGSHHAARPGSTGVRPTGPAPPPPANGRLILKAVIRGQVAAGCSRPKAAIQLFGAGMAFRVPLMLPHFPERQAISLGSCEPTAKADEDLSGYKMTAPLGRLLARPSFAFSSISASPPSHLWS